GTGADAEPDPRPRMALRLRRRRQRPRDLRQLPAAQGRQVRPVADPDRTRRWVRPPNAQKMTLSLRGRLLIGVMSLVIAGLLLSNVATYLLFQNALMGRIDNQLTSRTDVVTAASVISHDCHVGPGSAVGFPVN